MFAATLLKKTSISSGEFPKWPPRIVSLIPYVPEPGEMEFICMKSTGGVSLFLLQAVNRITANKPNLLKVISGNTTVKILMKELLIKLIIIVSSSMFENKKYIVLIPLNFGCALKVKRIIRSVRFTINGIFYNTL